MNKRTNLVFTLLQVAALLIALVGTVAAVFLGGWGFSAFGHFMDEQDYAYVGYAVVGLLTVAAVSVFSYGALYHFFTLCQRLKLGTAFTPANEKGMHRIAVCCGICGGTLFLALLLAFAMVNGFALPFVYLLLLFAIAYSCIALVAYALELLVRRATAIQQENDLTI